MDVEEQIKLESHDLKNLIKTVNEVRLDRGLAEAPWGNVLIIPFSNAEEAVLSPDKLKEKLSKKSTDKKQNKKNTKEENDEDDN